MRLCLGASVVDPALAEQLEVVPPRSGGLQVQTITFRATAAAHNANGASKRRLRDD
jgi:hypothetical protein